MQAMNFGSGKKVINGNDGLCTLGMSKGSEVVFTVILTFVQIGICIAMAVYNGSAGIMWGMVTGQYVPDTSSFENATNVSSSTGSTGLYDINVTIDGAHYEDGLFDNPCVVVDYTFTNLSNDARGQTFSWAANDKVFQNGVECESTWLAGVDNDNLYKDVKPGVSVKISKAYKLIDTTTPVVVEVYSGYDLVATETFSDLLNGNSSSAVSESVDNETTHVSEPETSVDPGFTVSIDDAYVGKTALSETPALIVTYGYTNNSLDSSKSKFSSNVREKLYQNGIQLHEVWVLDLENGDNDYREIRPGTTVSVSRGYELQDETSPVDVELYGVGSSGEFITSHTFEL